MGRKTAPPVDPLLARDLAVLWTRLARREPPPVAPMARGFESSISLMNRFSGRMPGGLEEGCGGIQIRMPMPVGARSNARQAARSRPSPIDRTLASQLPGSQDRAHLLELLQRPSSRYSDRRRRRYRGCRPGRLTRSKIQGAKGASAKFRFQVQGARCRVQGASCPRCLAG